MEDKQFEEMLRESWSPEPPQGMRERILRRSRRELPARKRRPLAGILQWKPVLVAAAITVILLMGVSERQRDQRMTALLNTPPAGASASNIYASLRNQQLQLAKLLSPAPSEYGDSKGDERL